MDAFGNGSSDPRDLAAVVQGIKHEIGSAMHEASMAHMGDRSASTKPQSSRPACNSGTSRNAAGRGSQDASEPVSCTERMPQMQDVTDQSIALRWNLNQPANAHGNTHCRRIASIHMLSVGQRQDPFDHSIAVPGRPTSAVFQLNEGAALTHRKDTLALQELLNNETVLDGWNVQDQAGNASKGGTSGSCQMLLSRKTTQDTWHQLLTDLFQGNDEVVRRHSTVTSQGLFKTLLPLNTSPLLEPVFRKDTMLGDLGPDEMSNMLQLNCVKQETADGIPNITYPVITPINVIPNSAQPVVCNMPVSNNQPLPYGEPEYHSFYGSPNGHRPIYNPLTPCYASPTLDYTPRPQLVSSPWAFGAGIVPQQGYRQLQPAIMTPQWPQHANAVPYAANNLMPCNGTLPTGMMHATRHQPVQASNVRTKQSEDVNTSGSSVQAVGEDLTSCSERHERYTPARRDSNESGSARKRNVRECDVDKLVKQPMPSGIKRGGGKVGIYKHRRVEMEISPQSPTANTLIDGTGNEQPCTPIQHEKNGGSKELRSAAKTVPLKQSVTTSAKQQQDVAQSTKLSKKLDTPRALSQGTDGRPASSFDEQPSSAKEDDHSSNDSDNGKRVRSNSKPRSRTKGEGGKPHLIPHPAVEKNRRNVLNGLIDELRDLIPPKTTSPSTHYSRGRDGTDHRPKHAVLSETIEFIRAVKANEAKRQMAEKGDADNVTP